MKAESLRSGRRGKRSDRERSERKSGAGGEKGPKLEQEAMLINNLADPRAPDTECIKYCWDTLLRHSQEERVKWCWKLQTLDKSQKNQDKVRAWTYGVEKFPFFSCSILSGQPTSRLHASSQLKHTHRKPCFSWMQKITHVLEFPGGPVVRNPRSYCRGPGWIPDWAAKIPQAEQCGQLKK